ncbi:MAG TPA: NAD(P)H-hydrate epimerase, partial [Limnochordia bacterium]|nr:NAD(P)H-hydrate epimerase [Limnochordia bacterium]
MRVLSGAQMQALDRLAAERYGVIGIALMEAAGLRLADAVRALSPQGPILIACGPGNNGGDGFVAARHLSAAGYDLDVWLAAPIERLRGDARTAFGAWRAIGGVRTLQGADDVVTFEQACANGGLIVDALLGTGVKGAAREPMAAAIAAINRAARSVLAVDVPSGVDADTGAVLGPAVRAARTLTFGAAKLGLLLRPGSEYAGRVEVAEIGLPAPLLQTATMASVGLVEASRLLPRRRADGHKGTF